MASAALHRSRSFIVVAAALPSLQFRNSLVSEGAFMFARIGRLFRGFFGLFISGIESRSPEALMEAARQEFRDKMANYNQALARMAGVAENLKSQVGMKANRAQDLERRILANHRAGNLEL